MTLPPGNQNIFLGDDDPLHTNRMSGNARLGKTVPLGSQMLLDAQIFPLFSNTG